MSFRPHRLLYTDFCPVLWTLFLFSDILVSMASVSVQRFPVLCLDLTVFVVSPAFPVFPVFRSSPFLSAGFLWLAVPACNLLCLFRQASVPVMLPKYIRLLFYLLTFHTDPSDLRLLHRLPAYRLTVLLWWQPDLCHHIFCFWRLPLLP